MTVNRAIDRGRHLRAVRRSGRARGSSAAGPICRGLRMQEELKRYSAKLVADGGMPIEARIGVNTGEVVVRSISTGGGHVEYTPIGHTTNLASRMQAVAPTGSIATSEQTRKPDEGYLHTQAAGSDQGQRC